jgi:uncharacterized protein YqcC (DUF446 family)
MNTEGDYNKLIEIREEMKRLGIWKERPPVWVNDFVKRVEINGDDFLDWLQFVYLPNCRQVKRKPGESMIAPQAVRFFRNDTDKGRLLQLLIELDSL